MKRALFLIAATALLLPAGARAQIHLQVPVLKQRSFPTDAFDFQGCAQGVQFHKYLSRLGELHWDLRKARIPVDNSKRVFYPAAAYDSAIARLFPDADIVAVDDHPVCSPEFLTSGDVIRLDAGQGGSYLRLGDIAREKYIGSRVFSGLVDSGQVLHDILYFSVETDPTRIHMLVLFSDGPKAKVRSYLQVEGSVPTTAEEARSLWWMGLLDDSPPDVVIAKSANHSLSPEGNPFMHATALDWLRETNGIALEGVRTHGAHPDLGSAEFAGGPIPSPVPRGVTRHWQSHFPGRFGYGDNVRALWFGPR